MRMLLTCAAAAALAASAGGLLAQEPPRGSTPPGVSRGGSGPSEGAIKGGTIQSGETSGIPQSRQIKRCDDLQGVLREQCLRDLESASGGASSAPRPLPGPVEREPRSAPPPQNPR